MNLRDLEYVVALADTRHFGRAAEQCHVSQPTLSMQIAKLERELGVPLFERDKRRVVATSEGERIAALATGALEAVRQIRETARAATHLLAGPFYLGVIPTIGPYLLPRILPALQKRYPELKLYLREETTERLLDRMHRVKLDAALLSLPLDHPAVEYAVVCTEEFVAALPADHALARRTRVRLEDFTREQILLLEEGNCMRDQTLRICKDTRPRDEEDFRASSIESLRQMVAARMGCTFLPRLSTEGGHATPAIAVRPFKSPAPTREIVLAWRRSHPKAETLRELAQALQASLREEA